MVYLWTKSLHLVFVMAWMASVFYLPRILVNLAEAGDLAPVRERLQLMGTRLYKFGHNMFGVAFVLGLVLWQGHRVWPNAYPDVVAGGAWMHAKLGLVALILLHFILGGRMLKRSIAGKALPSGTRLRLFNELPVFALLLIIYFVLAKPF
jgi:putative membrane protein